MQLGGSFLALISSLPYQENGTPVRLTVLKMVVSGLEQSTASQMARNLSHLELFIWSQVLFIICHIYLKKAAHHSGIGELLLLRFSQIHLKCESWQVVTGSRKMISSCRPQVLSSLTLQRMYIRMCPLIRDTSHPSTQSRLNDRHRFLTHVSIFPSTVAIPSWLVAALWCHGCELKLRLHPRQ